MITDESPEACDEGASGQVNIAYDVEREAVESENDSEERQIGREFQEILRHGSVKRNGLGIKLTTYP